MKKGKKAGLAVLLAAALLCACGQQPAPGDREANSSSASASATQNAPAQADAGAVVEQLRERYGLDEARLSAFEVVRASLAEPSEWDAWPRLEEYLTEEGLTWRGWLEADAARQLFVAELRVKYTPETAVCGPQYSDGIWTVLVRMEPADGAYTAGESMVAAIDEAPAPTSPDAAALGLTDDQWVMVDHQLAALVGCGVWRDYDSPGQWTQEEFTLWLALRAQDWPGTEDALSESDVLRMAQADFSPENTAWNSMDLRLQESGLLTDGRLDLPDAPQGAVSMEGCVVEYRREAAQLPVADEYAAMTEPEELVVTVSIGADAPVRMEYRFGLIPEGVGPVARPWLKQARLLDE